MKIKGPGKLILLVVLVLGFLGVYRHLVYTGAIRPPSALKTLLPTKADEVTAVVLDNPGHVSAQPLPTNKPVPACVDGNTRNCINGDVQEVEIWAWNANAGLIYATGGAPTDDGKGIRTSQNSLMAKEGVNVAIKRQDDTNQMQNDLLDTAQKLQSDPHASGVKFVTVMGDGGAQFFRAINPKLSRLAPDLQTEVVAVLGYSRGEDGFWGPQAWKDNPQAAKGGLVVGVLRDGDWNIAMKWAAQNNIPNNPDDMAYDPQALNWVNADSYTKAAEMYVASQCMDLPVKNKLGGGKIHKCIDGVVTWTPGDVTVAKKRGGIVPIMTTAQSVFQMPCVLIGIKRWDANHRDEVAKMLEGAFQGADQIRTNPQALERMGEVSQALYKENGASPEYWVKYYRGVNENDASGVRVHLGGSAVSNLADNLQAFGLSGGPNLFAATYNTFGRIVVQQYPNLVPDFPPVAQILNTSYVQAVQSRNTLPTNNQEDLHIASNAPIKHVEGRKNYAIQFRSGSADILPASLPVLNEIAAEVEITNYIVALHGHTDAAKWAGLDPQASADKNMELSKLRADAVKEFLESHGVKNTIRAYPHGQEEPVASNATESGRAQNRRVEVVLGTAEGW